MDFKCFLRPPADDDPNVDAHHIPSGFCVYDITDHKVYRMDPVVYSGQDVIANLFRHISDEAKVISAILSRDVPMAPLTASEMADSDQSVSYCANCGSRFLQTNRKHDQPLYSNANFHTLGKFKDEMANILPTEFCGLCSKMYLLAMLTTDREYHKAKGMPTAYVRKTSATISTYTSSATSESPLAS